MIEYFRYLESKDMKRTYAEWAKIRPLFPRRLSSLVLNQLQIEFFHRHCPKRSARRGYLEDYPGIKLNKL